MFARSVTIRLKPNSVAEFNRTLEKDILPLVWLRNALPLLDVVESCGIEVLPVCDGNEADRLWAS